MSEDTAAKIATGWDVILKEISREIDLNKGLGASAFMEGRYTDVDKAKDRVQRLVSLREKARALRDEWDALLGRGALPPDPKLPVLPKTRNFFQIPVLEALVRLGGSAERYLVFGQMEGALQDALTERERERMPYGSRSPRWHSVAGSTRDLLVRRGFLKKDTEHGVWAITDEGRRALEERRV